MRYTRLGSVNRGRMGLMLALMLLVSLLAPMTAWAAPVQSNPGNTEWVQVYTVKRGDTLSAIALSFGVSDEALLQANSLRNANVIYVGQQLIIPEKSSQGTGGPVCASYHTVRRGDTLSGIALYHGIDQYALARANGVYDLNDVFVGQTLCIPGSSADNYNPQQPVQPQRPAEGPQRPAERPECNPCDAPKNEGPQRPADGPQRPADEGQRPSDKAQCNPCDAGNEGPQRPSDGPQRPADEPQCNSCGGPERPDGDRPWHDGDKKPEALRPTEYWKGTYFKDKYFSEFAMERQDLEVNFNWMIGSPFGDTNQDRFSVRWEKVEYFRGGPYRFYATADDGVRVYVDDQLIIDGWVIQPATEYKADLNLSDGPHKVVVEYYEEAEDAQIRVYWEQRRHDK